jgi:hypothetical protein
LRDQAVQEKAFSEEALRVQQESAKARFLAALTDTQLQWLKQEAKRRVDTQSRPRLLTSRYPLYKAEKEQLVYEWMDRVDYGERSPHTTSEGALPGVLPTRYGLIVTSGLDIVVRNKFRMRRGSLRELFGENASRALIVVLSGAAHENCGRTRARPTIMGHRKFMVLPCDQISHSERHNSQIERNNYTLLAGSVPSVLCHYRPVGIPGALLYR